MKRVHSILFECNSYRGRASHERCKAVEEHVSECVGTACRLESATMRENDMGGGVVQATIELVYTKGDCREIIPRADMALLDIGIVAFKALVSSVASYAAEAVIAGAGAGAIAGDVATKEDRRSGKRDAFAVLAGTLIGAAVGAVAEKMVRSRVPYRIAVKQSGKWHIRNIPKQ